MGITTQAYTLFGVKLKVGDFMVKAAVKNCNCKCKKNGVFCQDCGERTDEVESVLPDFIMDEELYNEKWDWHTKYGNYDDNTDCFVGILIGQDGEYGSSDVFTGKIDTNDLSSLITDLKKDLNSDVELEIGIWTFLYESC